MLANPIKSLRDIPIQRKLRVVILVTCTAALVVACGALFAFQFFQFQQDFERDLAAVASIIASNSTGVLSFKVNDSAEKLLESLRAKPQITGAALILADGEVLAETGDFSRRFKVLSSSTGPSLQRQGSEYFYSYPVWLDGERIGTLVLHPDYGSQARDLIRVYAGILAGVLSISFLVAAVISWRLERYILGPIRYLAEITQAIASRDDYTVRAVKFVDDELGSFTHSFNTMLDQIENRDHALRHEIAERTRTEHELQRVHQQLLDASRQAGMAEVATGVLHNVGNVLNSVNVSATLISERLYDSKAANLAKAAAMLRANAETPDFLIDDPKGRLLPHYLAEATALLETERAEALAELALLTRNIEHIKDIVVRQQRHARVAAVLEELSLESLIEDALHMNAVPYERHGIAVVRDYDILPTATIDKHKVLQILVNIMRNAKNAMEEMPPPSRRLTICLRRKSGDLAEIRIEDTGIGIAPENLTRIFSHGFTTRRDGHGFGLHSAALTAQELGGKLSAESEGICRGAAFILDLPFLPPASLSDPV